MLGRCCLGLTAVCLAIGIGVPAFGADMSSPNDHSSYAMPATVTNWSRAYELTPLEMKRLRAKGLNNKEIFVVANAAMLTGRPVDAFVDMIFRGETTDQIAANYNLNPDTLRESNPMWQTAEWEQAVKEGRWSMPSSPAMPNK